MTQQNKSTLTALFEQGDVPSGTNFADLIDSCLNAAETSTQTMQGAINPTEVITARVSATNAVFTGTLRVDGQASASNMKINSLNADNATITNLTNTSANLSNVIGTTASFATVSAVSVYADAAFNKTGIVSAAGTTQATATTLTNGINICAGITDGSQTGFLLQANKTGLVQYVINGPASANLWPCVGGQINALASNAAFGMASNTSYVVIHTRASGYAVT